METPNTFSWFSSSLAYWIRLISFMALAYSNRIHFDSYIQFQFLKFLKKKINLTVYFLRSKKYLIEVLGVYPFTLQRFGFFDLKLHLTLLLSWESLKMEVRILGTWIYLETAGGEGGQWASVILTHLRYWDCELSQIAHQDFARKQSWILSKIKVVWEFLRIFYLYLALELKI